MNIRKRRVLILGGDGYLGWTTAMDFAAKGHDVFVVDNYLKRSLVKEVDSEPLFKTPKMADRVRLFNRLTSKSVSYAILDCTVENGLDDVFIDFSPDTVIHFAELPSAQTL